MCLLYLFIFLVISFDVCFSFAIIVVFLVLKYSYLDKDDLSIC